MQIKQGDIWLAQLNPTKGHEQAGLRPVVILSARGFHASGMSIICPGTTQIKSYPANPIIPADKSNGLTHTTEFLIGHIRSIDQSRLITKKGSLSTAQLDLFFEGFNQLCDRVV